MKQKVYKNVIVEKENADKFNFETKEVKVIYNFNHETIIGEAIIRKEKDVLTADITVFEKDVDGLFPAIGYSVIDGNNYDLKVLALCNGKNEDETIKPLLKMKPIYKLKQAIIDYQTETQTIVSEINVDSNYTRAKGDDVFYITTMELSFSAKTI